MQTGQTSTTWWTPTAQTSLKHCFKLVSLWVFRESRGFRADPPVLLRRHMLPASSAAHLIWREVGGEAGGFSRLGGWWGGQQTLRTKGYTELSLCVCALYSVCFSCSSLLRVAVGRHACVHGFLISSSSSSSSSSCVERKNIKHARNSAKQRDFCATCKQKTKQKHKHTTMITFFLSREKRWPWWCHILYIFFFVCFLSSSGCEMDLPAV